MTPETPPPERLTEEGLQRALEITRRLFPPVPGARPPEEVLKEILSGTKPLPEVSDDDPVIRAVLDAIPVPPVPDRVRQAFEGAIKKLTEGGQEAADKQ